VLIQERSMKWNLPNEKITISTGSLWIPNCGEDCRGS